MATRPCLLTSFSGGDYQSQFISVNQGAIEIAQTILSLIACVCYVTETYEQLPEYAYVKDSVGGVLLVAETVNIRCFPLHCYTWLFH